MNSKHAVTLLFLVAPFNAFAAVSVPSVQTQGSISDADYPKAAKKAQIEGDVNAMFEVDANGRVQNCRSGLSSVEPLLLQGTCKIVNRFRFRPAKDEQGTPVSEMRVQAFSWRLYTECNSTAPLQGSPGRICINLQLKKRR